MQANDSLEREFLPLRAKILEIAAGLDRLDRHGASQADPRRKRLDQALGLLCETSENRAEAIQLLFSRDYDTNWRKELELL